MPTPEEPTLPPSPPRERSDRQSFASCPPEEDRESHASHDNSEDEEEEASVTGAERVLIADHAIAQEPTPEPETLPGTSMLESRSKERVIQDAIDAPSPVASPDTTQSDAPRSQVRAQAQGEAQYPPQYLRYPPDQDRVCA